jgi:hypothetical protein
MKEIHLTGKYADQVVLVDDEDFAAMSQYRWQRAARGRTFYARSRRTVGGVTEANYMHVLIAGYPMVDHINGNGLDNRRENLRPVSSLENNRNSRKPATYKGRSTTSDFKGVCQSLQGKRRPWRAVIKVNYKQIYLGTFVTEEDAAYAYDVAAKKFFGEYAQLNFPEEQ